MGKLTRKTPLPKVFSYSLMLRKCIGFILSGLLILSCSGYPVRGDRPRGVYHRIKSGETLSIIARAYHVDLQDLAEINNIGNPDRIETDGVIFIPDAHQVVDDVMTAARPKPPPNAPGEDQASAAIPRAISKPEAWNREAAAQPGKHRETSPTEVAVRDRPEPSGASEFERDTAARRTSAKLEKKEIADQPVKPRENDRKSDQIQFDKKRFIWPVKGRVVSKFGMESITADYNGKKVETAKIMNNGIRIAAGAGTAVVSAGDGKVIYSRALEKFGNTIIVEHDDYFKTVYYDLGKRLVENMQTVRKGQPIAYLAEGKTPKGEAVMNFEIRHKDKVRNPLFFLP
jgi:lipoprotein NlpD